MKHKKEPKSAILLISCADGPGIVASVTKFISEHKGNILELDEHVDRETKTFLMRVQWELDDFDVSDDLVARAFEPIAKRFNMTWRLFQTDHVPRMAIFVSKQSHCLYDILSRHQSGEWRIDIPLIISNHEELRSVADTFGIPFHHFPVFPESKADVEQEQLALLSRHGVDLVVLARYMQILSPLLVDAYPRRIINIHHSFLPAFPGARPYHMAHSRGVKIIGATSHYVTAELDQGPIIDQETIRVSHKDSVKDFVRKGRDLEKIVLSRAIWRHLQQRIIVYNNRTIIFD